MPNRVRSGNRRSGSGGLEVILTGFFCLLPHLTAGEPVKFSDVNGHGLGSAIDGLPRHREVVGGEASSRPSLEGITAVPFAPVPSSPSLNALSPRDREALDRRRNWLFYSDETRSMTDQSVQQALGVRLLNEREDPNDATKRLARTAVERYLLEGPADAADAAGAEPLRNSLTANFLLSPPDAGDSRTPVFGGADFLRREDDGFQRGALSLGRSSLDALFENGAGGLGGRENGFLSEFASPNQFRELPGGDRREPSGIVRASEMLPNAPYEKAVGPRLSEILDPVNSYPDATREPLNPVVGSAQNPGSMEPLFSERNAPETRVGSLTRASALDLPGRGNAGLLGPVMGSATERGPKTSALKAMPVRLEIPGRSF